MPSAFRDPKTLADWIQLDYFRRPRRLRRWRTWLGWGTLFVSAVVVAVVILLPGGRVTLQAGPVSSAHALFNARCEKCHTEAFQTAKRLVPISTETIHAVPNSACVSCHDGPAHNEKLQSEQSCATCHREHRGRPRLALVSDDQCTVCHSSIKKSVREGTATQYKDVDGFPAGHPEFRLWREGLPDRGRLRFNHQAHLKPEGVFVGGGKKRVLDCSACHRVDSAGRFMQPIKYQDHCADCHPLSFQLADRFVGESLRSAAAAFEKMPAPHGDPMVVRAVLRERLIEFAAANPVVSKEYIPERAIPQPSPLRASEDLQWERTASAAEDSKFCEKQLAHVEEMLFDRPGGCLFCHIAEVDRTSGQSRVNGLPIYKPNLPGRWFEDARFGHDSHRMLACTECHAATESTKAGDILMPQIEACARCHNWNTRVRTDCVECHVYHHRERGGYEGSKGHTIAESLGEK